MINVHVNATARELQQGFSDADARSAAARVVAQALRAERADLMKDWAGLVATQDFDAIATRSMRLAEIDRELAKTGG